MNADGHLQNIFHPGFDGRVTAMTSDLSQPIDANIRGPKIGPLSSGQSGKYKLPSALSRERLRKKKLVLHDVRAYVYID